MALLIRLLFRLLGTGWTGRRGFAGVIDAYRLAGREAIDALLGDLDRFEAEGGGTLSHDDAAFALEELRFMEACARIWAKDRCGRVRMPHAAPITVGAIRARCAAAREVLDGRQTKPAGGHPPAVDWPAASAPRPCAFVGDALCSVALERLLGKARAPP